MTCLLTSLLITAALADDPEPADEPIVTASDVATTGDRSRVSVSLSTDTELRFQVMDLSELQGLDHVGGRQATYFEQVERLFLQANVAKWSFGIQLDEVAVWGTPYEVDGERRTAPPRLIAVCDPDAPCLFAPLGDQVYVNPEKLFAKYENDDLVLDLGDFYASFGFGMALAVNRNVEVDIDTSIQGARITATPGDWEITALVGQANRQQVQQDNPNRGMLGDYRHAILGVQAVRYGLGPTDLGAHVVGYAFADEPGVAAGLSALGDGFDVLVGGLTANLYGIGGIDWGFEGDLYGYPDAAFTDDRAGLGFALYGSATAYLGVTTWLVEGKAYKNHQFANYVTGDELYPMLVPPTLEYERAIVNKSGQAAIGSNEIYGGRVRTDFSAGDATPYLSFGVFRDLDIEGINQESPVPEVVYDSVAGVEWLGEHWTVLANGVFRYDDRDGTEFTADRMLHGDLDLKFPLPSILHGDLALAARRFWYGHSDLGDHEDYNEIEAALTLGIGSKVQLVSAVDYSRNPYAGSKGNLGADTYGSLELWVKPTSAWVIRTFVGSQKAGLKCSGGQCRQVPSFNGARIAVTGSL